MSENPEPKEEEREGQPILPISQHSPEDLQQMTDFLSKGMGHSASKEEASEALANLTRYFKWLCDHQDDLKDGSH